MATAAVPPSFPSLEAEAAFWRERAAVAEAAARDAREELEEFQEGSRELEAELETQLEQSEKKCKEFRLLNSRLTAEAEHLRDKLEQAQREQHCQVTELQSELSEVKSIHQELNTYIRELEQQNDDLERAKRNTLTSLEDFEARMNSAIERNAFLESELDEKETLKAAVQRMKDETKDLKAELRVLAPTRLSSQSSFNGGDNEKRLLHRRSTADSNKLAADLETKSESGNSIVDNTPPASSKSSPKTSNGTFHTPGSHTNQQQPLTPSARISALNIVGDLLRKVGALEVKLMSCRNIVKETSPSGGSVTGSTPGSGSATPEVNGALERTRRMTRGQSTPSLKKIATATGNSMS